MVARDSSRSWARAAASRDQRSIGGGPRLIQWPQLRAAAQLAMEQWALERAGQLKEVPYRRGHRIRILEHAIAPLPLNPAVRDRLHKALSVVYGIEPFVILKDIWGLADREVEGIALWMADVLIDAAIREDQAAAPGPARPSKRAKAGP